MVNPVVDIPIVFKEGIGNNTMDWGGIVSVSTIEPHIKVAVSLLILSQYLPVLFPTDFTLRTHFVHRGKWVYLPFYHFG